MTSISRTRFVVIVRSTAVNLNRIISIARVLGYQSTQIYEYYSGIPAYLGFYPNILIFKIAKHIHIY